MLLRPFTRSQNPFTLAGPRLSLRYPQSGDYAQWSELRERSRQHLQPWEPSWAPDELTRAAYRRRLTRYAQDMREERTYPFFSFTLEGKLVGGCTLSNVRRGVAQAASLGYWAGEPFAGQGYTSEAVLLVLGFAFDRLGLHRVEAACIPANAASKRVLEKCGFQQEGLGRNYLRINGDWRDHLLFAILAQDHSPGRSPR